MPTNKSIIIYRLGSLGDTIVALPSLYLINEYFPNRKKIILTNNPVSSNAPSMISILESTGLVDDHIEYSMGLRSVKALLQLRKSLKKTNSDTLIYLAASRSRATVFRDFIFFSLCGFSNIYGIPLSRKNFYNQIKSNNCIEFECERLLRTINIFGAVNVNLPQFWDLKISDKERNRAKEALSIIANNKFIAINMGGKNPIQDWGEKNWTELMLNLSRFHQEFSLVIVGAEVDRVRADNILRIWPAKGVNLCGNLGPRESAAVLSKATLFIGHDSGPLHLAASEQTPCVGIYGSNNIPNKWHPYGGQHRIIHNTNNVRDITVKEVFETVNKSINLYKNNKFL